MHKIFAKAKPKYAFVGDKNVFWEREPFTYPATHTYAEDASSSQSATRFISLGQFNNTTKQRQFYAFSVAPSSSGTTTDIPPNVTPCPFQIQSGASSSSKNPNKRALPEDDFDEGGGNSYIFAGTDRSSSDARKRRHGEPPQGYKCKICNVPGHFVQDCPEKVDQPAGPKKGANGAPPPETYVCRLCVSDVYDFKAHCQIEASDLIVRANAERSGALDPRLSTLGTAEQRRQNESRGATQGDCP